ncbi:hypothetical protein [Lamprocystis purpurea]|jgi:hypothetical protein|uniref:hypothetical protein n=1 Tax=Lamprocystis purpurea TaxID=61598 RepID=UPI0003649171|nr:hypothetical protein [Lamprocystis purpurea]MBV5346882.1 hypothetical protein [bacterium]
MSRTHARRASSRLLLALAVAAPGAAFAYTEKDAINDCESRIRSEYKITDLRDATAERLNDVALHFKVQGLAKVDGDKHPWTCEVKNRHVVSAEYSGPKPKGLGTAEKLAIGAAAVIGGAVAVNEMNKHEGASHTASGTGGAKELQDLVGARGSSGEQQLEQRGYKYVKGEQGGGSSYTNWRKGDHCVTVRTVNGHYASIVDVTMLDCE